MCIPGDSKAIEMKDEIAAAVLFLTRLIGKNEALNKKQIETFRICLHGLLAERFRDHWFPEKPCKGQAYRCIRINETERRDPILEEAARKCGLKYEDLQLPVELTIWVDPHEVCCRFGEHKGSYCTVASFKNGNKENFVDKINIEELEQRAAELLRKATKEFQWKRKVAQKLASPRKNGYNRSTIASQNILQQLPTLSPAQNFQPPLFLMPPTTFQRGVTPTQRFHFPSVPSSHITRPNTTFYPRQAFNPTSKSSSAAQAKYFHPFTSHVALASNTNTSSLGSMVRPNNSGKNDRYHWVNGSGVKGPI